LNMLRLYVFIIPYGFRSFLELHLKENTHKQCTKYLYKSLLKMQLVRIYYISDPTSSGCTFYSPSIK